MGKDADGGYYAIKGFLYQFDKSLIEILQNPDKVIMLEHREDIDWEDYVIQVKHKETQDYEDSKIRKPVTQLLDLSRQDRNLRFCLYCHFRDRAPTRWSPTIEELDRILGTTRDRYTSAVKEIFVENFFIQFSEDYESQFLDLLDLIKLTFALHNKGEAILYHSLFQSQLLELSLKAKDDRRISRQDLDRFTKSAERIIFYQAYANYIERQSYERLIKQEYFTFTTPNLDNFERLFVIDCDEQTSCTDLAKIVRKLSRKYFRASKSPQPFLCFRNLQRDKLIQVKQDLVEQEFMFNDGTCFDGDRFRLGRIARKSLEDESVKVKIIGVSDIAELLRKARIHEIYQFYFSQPLELETGDNHTMIQVIETGQILRLL